MSRAYIYDAVRTPRGRGTPKGALYEVSPVRLAALTLESIRDRNALDTACIDDVVLGCVQPIDDQSADIARTAALAAGYAQSVGGIQINRFCGSGLEAVNLAAAKVISGEADLTIGGGVESMSRVPLSKSGGPARDDPAFAYGLHFIPQGISADLLATRGGYSRSDVDAYAVSSQQRAAEAWNTGRFDRSVIPMRDQGGLTLLERDEHMRPNTTMDSLAQLRPSFETAGEKIGYDTVAIQRYPEIESIVHVHTPGNSSGVVDGAAAVLIGTMEAGERCGLVPRARVRAMASIGTEPTIMLTGPLAATQKVLAKAKMSIADVDLFEVNEAFAVVPLWFMSETGVTRERVNVNGGAIAMGHPLGATGAMLLGTLLDELERRGLGIGLVTLCVAGGMGTATIIERL